MSASQTGGPHPTADGPPLTVLMSMRDARTFVEAAAESILQQTWREFEFLVIDDASADGSSDVLRALAMRDSRLRVVRNERSRGLGYALDLGLRLARAPWVARMDADDIARPQRLERQMTFLRDNPTVDVIGTWATEIDEEGRAGRERRVPVSHEAIIARLWTNPFLHPTVVYRRDAVLRVGSYRPLAHRGQDYDLWFRCAEGGLRFANLPESLLQYRVVADTGRKMDLQTTLRFMAIGWRGCWRTRARPLAYLGVSGKLLKYVLARAPFGVAEMGRSVLRRLDPRNFG